MAWQSTLEQAKSIRFGRNTVAGLVAGILVGLLLGLLIGWVWWPVEWQGLETAAPVQTTTTGQFEDPQLQAQYLGAIADAFVFATGAGDPGAASVAAQRLALLGGDMRAAFDNAVDYYGGQADATIRINNLTTLASAVGITLGDAAQAANLQPGTQEPAVQAEQAAGGAAAASSENGANNGSANWLLTLFFAVVLIAGGLYILWILRRRQALGEEGGDGFAEEEISPAGASTPVFDRSALSPVRSSLAPAASIRSNVERPLTSQGGSPHGFDSEELDENDGDEYDGDEYDGDAEPDAEIDERVRYRQGSEREDDTLDDDPEQWYDAPHPAQTGRQGSPSAYVTSVGATPPYSGAASGPGEVRQPPANEEAGLAAAAPAHMPPATLQPPTPSRFERYTPVESYTATYFVGRVDFDYTKNVANPNGNNYAGEYGIGIHEKLGYLNNDLEKAIAIDIYLFDKTDERQPLSISRSLLSHYAYDHKRAEFEREQDNQTLPPIVAQPNTNFQLEGRQLLLDCLIKQVEYTPDGVFQNVTVELVLKRKS